MIYATMSINGISMISFDIIMIDKSVISYGISMIKHQYNL